MSNCPKNCRDCINVDAGNFFGSGTPPRKLTVGVDKERYPTNGDSWTDTDSGQIYIYQEGVWTLTALSGSGNTGFSFTIETATGSTSAAIDVFQVMNGDTVRFFSEGGIFIEATTGSVNLQIEPNNIKNDITGPSVDPEDPTRPAIHFNTFTDQIFYWNTDSQTWERVSFDESTKVFSYNSLGASTGPSEGDLVTLKFNSNSTVKKLLADKWEFTNNIVTNESNTGINIKPELAADMNGNLYVAFLESGTGPFYRNREIIGASGASGILGSNRLGSDSTIRLGKMNSNGGWEWVGLLEGQAGSELVEPAIAVDCNSNLYLMGGSTGSGIEQYRYLNPSGNTESYSVNNRSLLINKIDSEGNFVWKAFASTLATGSIITNSRITTDNVNYVYVTAQSNTGTIWEVESQNQATEQVGTGLSLNNPSVFLGKISEDGIWQWQTVIAGTGADLITPNMTVDDFNNLYLTFGVQDDIITSGTGDGRTAGYGPIEFYDKFGRTNLQATGSENGRFRYIVTKNVDGVYEWQARVDVSNPNDNSTPDLTTDSNGIVYCAFTDNSNINKEYFNAGDIFFNFALTSNAEQIFLPRINPSGQWITPIHLRIDDLNSTGTNEIKPKIVRHASGDFIVSGVGRSSGSTLSVPRFVNDDDTTEFSGQTAAFSDHIFMGRFNRNGKWVWRNKIDITDNLDITHDLVSNNYGQVYVAGYVGGTITPIFYNRDDNTGLMGMEETRQIFIGRLTDESISAENIGIIQGVTGTSPNEVLSVEFNNFATYLPGNLTPGIPYYIDSGVEYNNVLNEATLTSTKTLTPSGFNRRLIGESCSSNQLILNNNTSASVTPIKPRNQITVSAGPTGVTGPSGPTGSTGPQGETGAKGDPGTIAAECFNYTFGGTSSSGMDPGTGVYLTDNSDVDLVTRVFIDNIDNNSSSSVSVLKGVLISTNTVKGFIDLTCQDPPNLSVLYRILGGTGFGSDATGYYELAVEKFMGDTGTIFDTVMGCTATDICITRSGDRGDVGPTGSVGPTGATGPAGALSSLCYDFEYSGVTTIASDPGTGFYFLNNINVGDATALFIDTIDKNGNSIAPIGGAILDAILDPNDTSTAFATLNCIDDTNQIVLYQITNGTYHGVNPSGYFEFAIVRASGETGPIFGGSGCTATTVCLSKTGEEGPKGEKGNKGEQGAKGPQGPGGGTKGDPGNTVRVGFSGYVRPNLDAEDIDLVIEDMRHGDFLLTTEDDEGNPLTRIYMKCDDAVINKVEQALDSLAIEAGGTFANPLNCDGEPLQELTELWIKFVKTAAFRIMFPQFNVLRDPEWYDKLGGDEFFDNDTTESIISEGIFELETENIENYINVSNLLFLDREVGKTGGNTIYSLNLYNVLGVGPSVVTASPIDGDTFIDLFIHNCELYVYEDSTINVPSGYWLLKNTLRTDANINLTNEQYENIRNETSDDFGAFALGIYFNILSGKATRLANDNTGLLAAIFGFILGLVVGIFAAAKTAAGAVFGGGGGGGGAGGGGGGGGGSAGPIGPQGPAGPRGPSGDDGMDGDKGDKGDKGEPNGPTGPTGPKGDPGGPTGYTGPTGTTGPSGMDGTKWFVQGDTAVTGTPTTNDYLLNTKDCQIYLYDGADWVPNSQYLRCGEEICLDFDVDYYSNEGTTPNAGDLVTLSLDSSVNNKALPRKLLNDAWEWSLKDGDALSTITTPILVNDNCSNVYLTVNKNSGGLKELSIKKYDINGNEEWEITSNDASHSDSTALFEHRMAANQLGDIYLTDLHSVTIDFMGTNSTSKTFTHGGTATEMFVLKFNNKGEIENGFSITADNSENSIGVQESRITTDSCNNLYLAGRSLLGLSTHEIVFNDLSLKSQPRNTFSILGSLDNTIQNTVFLAKYDSQDTIQWTTKITSSQTGNFSVDALAADSCGNVYIAGNYGSTAVNFFDSNGDNSDSLSITSDSTIINDVYLAKYNSDGEGQWSIKIEIPNNNNSNNFISIEDLDIDECGDVYLSGSYFVTSSGNRIDFYDSDKVDFNTNMGLSGSGGPYMAKYSAGGKGIWSVRAEPSGVSIAGSKIKLDNENGIYWVFSSINTNVKFYDSKKIENTNLQQSLGGIDTTIFLAKYTREGKGIYSARINGADAETNPDVAIDKHNQAYVAGEFNSLTVNFTNRQRINNITRLALTRTGTLGNIFLAKYANDIKQSRFIGVVNNVDLIDNNITIQFDSSVEIFSTSLIVGSNIFLDTSNTGLYNEESNLNLLTNLECGNNNTRNRCLGVSVSSDTILIKPSDPLVYESKKGICAKVSNTNANQNVTQFDNSSYSFNPSDYSTPPLPQFPRELDYGVIPYGPENTGAFGQLRLAMDNHWGWSLGISKSSNTMINNQVDVNKNNELYSLLEFGNTGSYNLELRKYSKDGDKIRWTTISSSTGTTGTIGITGMPFINSSLATKYGDDGIFVSGISDRDFRFDVVGQTASNFDDFFRTFSPKTFLSVGETGTRDEIFVFRINGDNGETEYMRDGNVGAFAQVYTNTGATEPFSKPIIVSDQQDGLFLGSKIKLLNETDQIIFSLQNIGFDPVLGFNISSSSIFDLGDTVFIAKYRENLILNWTASIRSSTGLSLRSLATDSGNDLIAVGNFTNDVIFYNKLDTRTFQLFGNTAVGEQSFICKYNNDGNFDWAVDIIIANDIDENNLSTSDYVRINKIDTDQRGGIYVSGDIRLTDSTSKVRFRTYEIQSKKLSYDTNLDIQLGATGVSGMNGSFIAKYKPGGEANWNAFVVLDDNAGSISNSTIRLSKDKARNFPELVWAGTFDSASSNIKFYDKQFTRNPRLDLTGESQDIFVAKYNIYGEGMISGFVSGTGIDGPLPTSDIGLSLAMNNFGEFYLASLYYSENVNFFNPKVYSSTGASFHTSRVNTNQSSSGIIPNSFIGFWGVDSRTRPFVRIDTFDNQHEQGIIYAPGIGKGYVSSYETNDNEFNAGYEVYVDGDLENLLDKHGQLNLALTEYPANCYGGPNQVIGRVINNGMIEAYPSFGNGIKYPSEIFSITDTPKVDNNIKSFTFNTLGGLDKSVGSLVTPVFNSNTEVRTLLCEEYEWSSTIDFEENTGAFEPSMYINNDSVYISFLSNGTGNIFFKNRIEDDVLTLESNLSLIDNENKQVLVAKSDRYSNWQWIAGIRLATGADFVSNYIVTDRLGHSYVGVEIPVNSAPIFISSNNTATFSGAVAGERNIVIGKIDSNGNWLYSATVYFESISMDMNAIEENNINLEIVNDDGIVVSGTYDSDMLSPVFVNSDNSLSSITFTQDTVGKSAFISKLDRYGNWEWATRVLGQNVTGSNGDVINIEVKYDKCESIYVVNEYKNKIGYSDINDNITLFSRTTNLDERGISVAKLSINGEWLWSASIDSSGTDESEPKLAIDPYGDVYVAGYGASGTSSVFYNYDENSFDVIGLTGIVGLSQQVFVGKINPSGIWQWQVAVDFSSQETRPVIDADYCGELLISGYTDADVLQYYNKNKTSDFTQILNVSTPGALSFFIGKFTADGEWNWVKSIGETSIIDKIALKTDNMGNLYLLSTTDELDILNITNRDDTTVDFDKNFGYGMFLVKITNDALSNDLIGIINGIKNDLISVSYDNVVTVHNGDFIPGVSYYIDTGVGINATASLTTERFINGTNCRRRLFGVACGENEIVRSYERPSFEVERDCPAATSSSSSTSNDSSKLLTLDTIGGSNISVGDLVSLGFGANKAHKLLCEQWEWNIAVDSALPDRNSSITTDVSGNLYVALESSLASPADFKNRNGDVDFSSAAIGGSNYILVGRSSKSGFWDYQLRVDVSTGSITEPALASDSFGNIYLAGVNDTTQAPVFTNRNGTTALGFEGSTGMNIFVAKFSNDGILVWSVIIDNNVQSPSLVIDDDDNIILSGEGGSSGPIEFYDMNNSLALTGPASNGFQQIFIGKLMSDGFWDWGTVIQSDDGVKDAQIATDGTDIYVVGTEELGFGDELIEFYDKDKTTTVIGSAGQNSSQVFIGKLDAEGFWEWSAKIDATGVDEISPSVSADCFGNIFVGAVGGQTGVINFVNGEGNVDFTGPEFSFDGNKIFIGKITNEGFWDWQASVDSIQDDFQNVKIVADNCGGVFVAGKIEDSSSFPVFYSDKSLQFSGETGNYQIIVSKLDKDGKWLWSNKIETQSDLSVLDNVTIDSLGNFYLAGTLNNGENPDYFNRDGNFSISGVTAASNQVFVGKLANEANSQKIIGIVQEINGVQLTVQFDDIMNYSSNNLVPGLEYFIDCGTGTVVDATLTSQKKAYNSLCPRRCVGVACDTNVIAWNLSEVVTKTICVSERIRDFSFQIQVKDSEGNITSGPFRVTNNELVNFTSGGGVSLVTSEGSVNIEINPNNIISGIGNPSIAPDDPTRDNIYINNISGEAFCWMVPTQQWMILSADSADLDSGTGAPSIPPTDTGSLALHVENNSGDLYYWNTQTQQWELIVSRPNQKVVPFSDLGGTGVSVGSLVTFDTFSGDTGVHLLLCDKWIWETQILGQTGNVSSPSMAVSLLGDSIYIAGHTDEGATRFLNAGSGELAGATVGTYQSDNIWIGLMNTDGAWQYRARIDGVNSETNPVISIDFDDAVYLAAESSSGNIPQFINKDNTLQFSGRTAAGTQILVSKINNIGEWFFTASIDGLGNETRPAIASASNDDIWVAGEGASGSEPIFYSDDGSSLVGFTGMGSQIFVGRLDQRGNWKNRVIVDGQNTQEKVALTPDYQGNCYVAGLGSIDGTAAVEFRDNSNEVNVTTDAFKAFVWVGKLLKNGTWNYSVVLHSDSDFNGVKITSDQYGSFYVAASLENNSIYNIIDISNVSETGLSPMVGGSDSVMTIVKFSPEGDYTFDVRIECSNSSGYQIGDLEVDGGGRIFVSARTSGDSIFYNADSTTGFGLETNGSGDTIFIAELNPCGYWKKVHRVDVSSDTDSNQLPAMRTSALGDIYLATQVTGGYQPEFYNSFDEFTSTGTNLSVLTGETAINQTQIIVGKIVNESRSSELIGVVTAVEPDLSEVTVNFSDRADAFTSLDVGITYYLDCENNSLTASNNSTDGNYFRKLGVACSSSSIIFDLEDIISIPKFDITDPQPFTFDGSGENTRIITSFNVGNSVAGDNSSVLGGTNNEITTDTTEAAIVAGKDIKNDVSGVFAHGDDFTVSSFATGASFGDIVCNKTIYGQSVVNISDERMKNIIGDVSDVEVDDFLKLAPKEFTFKNDDKQRSKYGLIAQDVEKTFNWAVENAGETDANKFLDPMTMIGLLTKALQSEIRARKELEERVKELENKLN